MATTRTGVWFEHDAGILRYFAVRFVFWGHVPWLVEPSASGGTFSTLSGDDKKKDDHLVLPRVLSSLVKEEVLFYNQRCERDDVGLQINEDADKAR